MENNAENIKDKSKAKSSNGNPQRKGGDIRLPPSTDIWRRVFNQNLKCYEIYIRKSNVLVATGIGNTGDSFLIGALPLIVETLNSLLKEIENGQVKEDTFARGRHILDTFEDNIRKGETVGGTRIFGLNSPELDLGGQGGGSYQKAELFD